MLFQAVMNFLSRLVWIKVLVIRGKVNYHPPYQVIRLGWSSALAGRPWELLIRLSVYVCSELNLLL